MAHATSAFNVDMLLSNFEHKFREDANSKISAEYTRKDYGPIVKTFKLSMVLLILMFSNDDNKISNKEEQSFSKVINSIREFSSIDRNDLRRILRKLPDNKYVLDYIEENELSKETVDGAISFVLKEVKLKSRYVKIIEEFRFLYEGLDK